MTRRTGTVAHQLQQAEAELADLKRERALTPFYEEFGDKLVLGLQTIPLNQWPHIAQIAFAFVEREMPTLAAMAKEELPQ